MTDFLKLVYIVIPKLKTNPRHVEVVLYLAADGPEPVVCLSPQHACFLALKAFSRQETWGRSELSLIALIN